MSILAGGCSVSVLAGGCSVSILAGGCSVSILAGGCSVSVLAGGCSVSIRAGGCSVPILAGGCSVSFRAVVYSPCSYGAHGIFVYEYDNNPQLHCIQFSVSLLKQTLYMSYYLIICTYMYMYIFTM